MIIKIIEKIYPEEGKYAPIRRFLIRILRKCGYKIISPYRIFRPRD